MFNTTDSQEIHMKIKNREGLVYPELVFHHLGLEAPKLVGSVHIAK